MSRVSSPLCCVCSWALWAELMHVSLPGPGELSYYNIPNNSRGAYFFQSLNRPGVYFGSGGNLGQAFNSFLSKIRDEDVTNFASLSVNSLASFCNWSLLQRRKRYSEPALAANSSSLLPRWRTFVSPSPWSISGTLPFADHPFRHVYLRLLACLLPPSTRQPGPVAVLLRQTLKLSFIFSPISHVLNCVNRETSRRSK